MKYLKLILNKASLQTKQTIPYSNTYYRNLIANIRDVAKLIKLYSTIPTQLARRNLGSYIWFSQLDESSLLSSSSYLLFSVTTKDLILLFKLHGCMGNLPLCFAA